METFVNKVPSIFLHEGSTIQHRRNIIKEYNYMDIPINIKSFKKPIFINRFIYTFFRKPKAYRAYYNALSIINKGFKTPSPIAFIEQYSNGLLTSSYFISIQLNGMREIREYYDAPVSDDNRYLFSSFAQYTAKLHDAGILHRDYSPGNILVSENNNQYEFALIDINRMSFQEIDLKEGCKNLARLFGSDDIYIYIAAEYAKARNLDIDECIKYSLYYKHKFDKKKERKKKLKAFINR